MIPESASIHPGGAFGVITGLTGAALSLITDGRVAPRMMAPTLNMGGFR
jgi:hypothetical protein